jgi:hypothetical protein
MDFDGLGKFPFQNSSGLMVKKIPGSASQLITLQNNFSKKN